jgi:hypothetical protein
VFKKECIFKIGSVSVIKWQVEEVPIELGLTVPSFFQTQLSITPPFHPRMGTDPGSEILLFFNMKWKKSAGT